MTAEPTVAECIALMEYQIDQIGGQDATRVDRQILVNLRRLSTLEAENERLRAALAEAEKRLTQALGIIVEFGDLNGFRNLSDQELGAAVLQMAKAGAATIDHLRATLSGDPK